jgi:hypothetical protein
VLLKEQWFCSRDNVTPNHQACSTAQYRMGVIFRHFWLNLVLSKNTDKEMVPQVSTNASMLLLEGPHLQALPSTNAQLQEQSTAVGGTTVFRLNRSTGQRHLICGAPQELPEGGDKSCIAEGRGGEDCLVHWSPCRRVTAVNFAQCSSHGN